MDDQNKNLILAFALSFLVILVWYTLFPPPEQPLLPPADPAAVSTTGAQGQTQASGQAGGTGTGAGSTAMTPTGTAAPGIEAAPAETRADALAKSKRVEIRTPRLAGSFSLKGGRIDDLSLLDYNVRLNDPSEKVVLLTPAGAPDAYYALYGWAPAGGIDYADLPGPNTEWTVESGSVLEIGHPVTLRWDNGKGQVFRRTLAIDDNYMFTVTQSVENAGDSPISVFPYGIVARQGEPKTVGFYILHEGVVRLNDDKLQEIKYKDMPDMELVRAERANADLVEVQKNGWVGFTSKYWMTSLIPQPGQSFTSVAKYAPNSDTYQTEVRLPVVQVAPGARSEATTMLFAGAKEWDTIRHYQNDLGIAKFIDSIDWGWFFFLTKPIFQVLHFLNGLIGNMGWAIIGLTLIIKALLFPLAYRSFVSMAKMKELQPEMEKIKERAGDDRQMMQQEMMKLYREKKVSPASGCLPILLQIPIFFSLYKVIFVTIELRHAPWILWIQDLSAPDPTSILNLFGLLPFAAPDHSSALGIFSIGVLPILLGISMWLQQKLNPAPTDPAQATIFAWMPWVFMFMLGRFASGLVLYWIANNTITFTQQYLIMRSQGIKPDVFGNIRRSFQRKPKAAPAAPAAKGGKGGQGGKRGGK